MTTTRAPVVVIEIERSDGRPLSSSLQRSLGEALLAEPVVEAAWIAAADAGTPYERRSLQVAVSERDARPDRASDSILPAIVELQRLHRVTLAVYTYGKASPDVVPREVMERIGLRPTADPRITLHLSISPRRGPWRGRR